MGWQDISTAPKDGTRLLLAPFFNSKFPAIGYWTPLYGGCWYAANIGHLNADWKPGCWILLPVPGSSPTPAAAEARATKATIGRERADEIVDAFSDWMYSSSATNNHGWEWLRQQIAELALPPPEAKAAMARPVYGVDLARPGSSDKSMMVEAERHADGTLEVTSIGEVIEGSAEAKDGAAMVPEQRDILGRAVREAWVRWAITQPNPKPAWLVPWDGLNETDKEADRQIGEYVYETILREAVRRDDAALGDVVDSVTRWRHYATLADTNIKLERRVRELEAKDGAAPSHPETPERSGDAGEAQSQIPLRPEQQPGIATEISGLTKPRSGTAAHDGDGMGADTGRDHGDCSWCAHPRLHRRHSPPANSG